MAIRDTSSRPLSVVLVDDYRHERDVMAKILLEQSEYYPVKLLRFADEAVDFCEKNPVDIVIIDVMMPRGMDGIKAAEKLRSIKPNIKIILITSACEDSWIPAARAAGADSFWYKNYSRESFLEIVDRTAAGESIYPDVTPNAPIGNATRDDFSKMDLIILKKMMSGLSNSEIAAQVGLTPDGVRYHIKTMLKKTGLPNRVSLIVNAARFGIVVSDDQ